MARASRHVRTLCAVIYFTIAGSQLPAIAQTSIDPYATGGYAGTAPGYGNPITNVFSASPTWFGSQPSAGGYGGLPPLGPLIDVPPATRLWLRGEYLRWWTEGMSTPVLATTSPAGTPSGDAGVLGLGTTQALFGGDPINEGATNGMRFRGGFFLTPAAAFGIEGEYFALAEQNDSFFQGPGGDILARPYFDPTRDREASQLIEYSPLQEGSLNISSETNLRSMLLAGRASLCPTCGGNCIACRNNDRVDWIVGYRRIRLEDELAFVENVQHLDDATSRVLMDRFHTKNEINALQLGVTYQADLKRVWLESMLRVAVGQNKQSVGISGSTTLTDGGVSNDYAGGFLAQTTNAGSYRRDQFTMVPEIGVTLGIRVFDWLHGTVGYNLLYLPSVVRAGDQIDLDINSTLLAPPPTSPTGSQRPQFNFIESDYYAHGLSLGLQLQF